MVISTGTEKGLDKIEYSFMIKKNKTQDTRNRGTFLKLIKGIHEKPTVILLKDERLKTFFLKIQTRDIPGGPMIKNPAANTGDRFNP